MEINRQSSKNISAKLPFDIQTIESNFVDQDYSEVPHRHNYFEITWVVKGSGSYLIDLQKYEITEHTIYCVTPGQVHQFNAGADTKGYVISFRSEFLYLSPLSHPTVTKLDDEMTIEMEEITMKLLKEFNNFFLMRSEILRGFFKIFLIYLTRQWEPSVKTTVESNNTELVKKFFSTLEEKFTTKKKVADYADELAVTPNYLNEIVKKISGYPASYHIQQRIILEAKRQASYTHASMKEIAYQLGFDDIAHFSKFFKNVSGLCFSDYKKNNLIQPGFL